MPPQKIELTGRHAGRVVFRGGLAPGEHVIGREPGCEIRLEQGGISRRHAKVTVTANAVSVEDLGSINGVSIRGRPVIGATAVAPGVPFEVGEVVFQWSSARTAALPVPGTQRQSSPIAALLVVAALAGGAAFLVPKLLKNDADTPDRKPVVAADATKKKEFIPTATINAGQPPPVAKVEPTPTPAPAAPTPKPAETARPTPVPAVAKDDYPGVPVLSFATTVPAGDPDFQQLIAAAKWAAKNGGWARLQKDLDDALVKLASGGGSMSRASNVERMVERRLPAAVLAQARFIRSVGADTLDSFAREQGRAEFIAWLFAHPAILGDFDDTIEPRDRPRAALEAWADIWKSDAEGRETFANLAIACALVFDQPVRISASVFGEKKEDASISEASSAEKEVNAVSRYRFFRDSAKRGVLRAPITEMTARDLAWVVDAPVPESELVWAQKHMSLSRSEWSRAYGIIRYRMDRATQGVNPYSAYTLAEILKEGGICGDQAYFAAVTAKANGIPAMVISGTGDRGAHAWFGYKVSRNAWNLTTGRYNDSYAAGHTTNPQTHERMAEHELKMLADPVRRSEHYEKSDHLVAFAKLLGAVSRADLAAVALDVALKLTPKHLDGAFAKLTSLQAAKIGGEDWQAEVARMRVTFHGFSDVIQRLDKLEMDYVSQQEGGAEAARKLAQRSANRMSSRDRERTDLILESVFREADLAESAGEADKIGRIYRKAMTDKGAEMQAFEKIAERYYKWGVKAGKGPTTVRDILATFDSKHKEPGGDVFAMDAYRGALGKLIDMAKEQGLATQERSLGRRDEKLKNLRDKLAREHSKNAAR